MDDKDFTAMVCSKILHDLAGPIGAVMNGAELIEESHTPGLDDIVDLLKSSSTQLTALLQVFRVGFGALSTGGQEVEAGMIKSHLEDYTGFKGVPMAWQLDEPMIDKDVAKIIVNAVFLITEMARKKGQLQIANTAGHGIHGFSVAAFGEGIRVPEDIKAVLTGTGRPEVTTGNIPAYIIRQIAGQVGMVLDLSETPSGVVFKGQKKG